MRCNTQIEWEYAPEPTDEQVERSMRDVGVGVPLLHGRQRPPAHRSPACTEGPFYRVVYPAEMDRVIRSGLPEHKAYFDRCVFALDPKL